MATPMVRAEAVHKNFGRNEVLRGIDIEVAPREVMCIIGPSGSGKSTFLRCINHLEKIDAGRLWVDGELVGYRERGGRLHELPDREVCHKRSEIGMVFQGFNLFPHMTALGNVIEAPVRVKRESVTAATERGRALLDRVGLGDKVDAHPRQLSGGQQQRVALARALAVNPTLVLLDEPFSSLDAGLRSSVRADVQDVLRKGGITAVLVTHDQDEALSVADQVAVIRNGTIGQCGTPQELYDHPVDAAMARFLGDANLVAATVAGDRVDTPFGPLALRRGLRAPVLTGPVVALIRPEQLVLSTTVTGAGLKATVVRTQFHGHDTVITVDPVSAADPTPLTIRAEGDLVVANGTEVEITAEGSALAWAKGDGDR
jgi:polar amino acid transport system ATP-binding protein